MKPGVAVFVIWCAGAELGLCLGNHAAGGTNFPQAWASASLLSLIAVYAIATILRRKP